MNIKQIIDSFYKILNIGENLKLITVDLKVIAVKELNIQTLKLDYTDDLQNAFEDSLALLKDRGIIFNYERLENGFKIFPEDKIYPVENDLIVKFNEK